MLTEVTSHTWAWATGGHRAAPAVRHRTLRMCHRAGDPAGITASGCGRHRMRQVVVSSEVVPDFWSANSVSFVVQLPGLASEHWGLAEERSLEESTSFFQLMFAFGDWKKFWVFISGWSLCSLLKWLKKTNASLEGEKRTPRQKSLLTHFSLPEVSTSPQGAPYLVIPSGI